MILRSLADSLVVACALALLGCAGSPLKASRDPQPVATTQRTSPAAGRLAEAADHLVGTWRCQGRIYGPDGAASPSEAALEVRLVLDGAWLQTELAVLSGEHAYKFSASRAFDASSSSWVNVIIDNIGGHAVSRSKDAITWSGESAGPMGAMKIRDTETVTAPGALRMVGQYALADGAWRTGYELSCAK